jgi:ABC-2 type transport system permease protein
MSEAVAGRRGNSLRLLGFGWLFGMKKMSQSLFFILTSAIQPVIFATIAFYMFKSGNRGEGLLYVALGAGLMGIWSSTLFGSGGMIQWERYQGTLEVLMAAPSPFIMVLLPATLATSTVGLYSLTATILWGRLFFHVPLELVHPVMFFVAIVATVVGLGLLGLLLASTFVLYRNANALCNLLEYPVWLVTGLLVPVAFLPSWAAPISWLLAPTWGIKALRSAALGGDPLPQILMTFVLAACYLLLASIAIRKFDRLARERATLSLT